MCQQWLDTPEPSGDEGGQWGRGPGLMLTEGLQWVNESSHRDIPTGHREGNYSTPGPGHDTWNALQIDSLIYFLYRQSYNIVIMCVYTTNMLGICAINKAL